MFDEDRRDVGCLSVGRFHQGRGDKLRLVADGVLVGCGVAKGQEMAVFFRKGASRHWTVLKAELYEEMWVPENKDCTLLNDILAQGKTQQFRTDALILELWFYCQRFQVQATNLFFLIGMGKGNVGDYRVSVQTHPLKQVSVIFMEGIEEPYWIVTTREGLA